MLVAHNLTRMISRCTKKWVHAPTVCIFDHLLKSRKRFWCRILHHLADHGEVTHIFIALGPAVDQLEKVRDPSLGLPLHVRVGLSLREPWRVFDCSHVTIPG